MKWIAEKFSPAHPPASSEHAHVHEHGSHLHFHRHSHGHAAQHHRENLVSPSWLRAAFRRLGLFHALRPLLVGMGAGLAGSAAVSLLVLSTIREPKWAVFYLLIFGGGTITGMMLVTAAL